MTFSDVSIRGNPALTWQPAWNLHQIWRNRLNQWPHLSLKSYTKWPVNRNKLSPHSYYLLKGILIITNQMHKLMLLINATFNSCTIASSSLVNCMATTSFTCPYFDAWIIFPLSNWTRVTLTWNQNKIKFNKIILKHLK